MELTDLEINGLVDASISAKENSYARYSNFRVGAALLTDSGQIIKGCNVENASYGLTVCAERTAICKAVSDGYRKFKAIAISSDMPNRKIVPCGACRQFISEFGPDIDVIMVGMDKSYEKLKISVLLPSGFQPDHLEETRRNFHG